MNDNELNDTINAVMNGYKQELTKILNDNHYLLTRLDEIFLLPLDIDPEGDSVTDDFIDGFAEGLLHAGAIKNTNDANRLISIIKSARALHRL